MKVLISNGNPDPNHLVFEVYLGRLEQSLAGLGHTVTRLNLRDLDLRGCTGCFNCWVKTPGECIQHDDGPRLRQEIISSDFHLMASPLRMGFPSALTKVSLDKSVPLIHPYVVVDHGEAHHRARYDRYPRMGLLVETEVDTDERDRHIIADIFSRAALNFKSKLEFSIAISEKSADDLAATISGPRPKTGILFDEDLSITSGNTITSPSRLTLFNGSPRGQKGNTPLLFSHFLRGFESHPSRSSEMFHLNRTNDREIFQQAFGEAECVIVGFPLYVDSVPAQVKAFFESLEGYKGRPNNPPIGFLLQSGFPEALHSRHVERYLEKLAVRLGSPYLGTMLRGGVEGIQSLPEKMTAGLFEELFQLGRLFGETGRFDPDLLRKFSGMEKFQPYMVPIFKLLARLPMLNMSWDQELKKNGVYAQRFARPYHQ